VNRGCHPIPASVPHPPPPTPPLFAAPTRQIRRMTTTVLVTFNPSGGSTPACHRPGYRNQAIALVSFRLSFHSSITLTAYHCRAQALLLWLLRAPPLRARSIALASLRSLITLTTYHRRAQALLLPSTTTPRSFYCTCVPPLFDYAYRLPLSRSSCYKYIDT
jgi:hypothetical protein